MTCVISNLPLLRLIILFSDTPKLKEADFLKVISLSILRLLLLKNAGTNSTSQGTCAPRHNSGRGDPLVCDYAVLI